MAIRVLSQNLINQIAAGEVIERPASVIKELVENSLDAGASDIKIDVRNAGKSYISVSDNGVGMSKHDLELSILRHATSKLLDDDLTNINFLGFRGEALPSIASVSKMIITTNNGKETWALHLEGGVVKKIIPASSLLGTKIEVFDLFYNVPARMAFLKSDRAEMSSIIDVVERIAISHHEKSFSLNNTLNFRKASEIDRVCDVLGKDFKENSIQVEASKHNFRIHGFISRPTYNKGTSSSQYFYVNGRALKDKLLFGSLKAGYLDVIEKGKFPLCALWLDIPLSDIDVNVHPQKAEIRFKNQAEVRGAIVSLIRSYLSNADISVNVIDVNKSFQNFDSLSQKQNFITFPNIRDFKKDSSFMDTIPSLSQMSSFVKEEKFNDFSLPSVDSKTVACDDVINSYPLGVARGQVHNTYIISQVDDGIIILDQHACHERIVYEKIKQEFLSGSVKRQILLLPEIVDLGEKYTAVLIDMKEELLKFGLDIDLFAKDSIVVREVPAILGDCNIQSLIKDIVDDFDSFNKIDVLEDRIAMIAKTYACHTSIRAGRSLSIDEMNHLLRQVEHSQNSGQCNHGRRSYVKLSLRDLDKLFDR